MLFSDDLSRAAKFAQNYRLAFTLLLEDVTDSSGEQFGWEIERGLDREYTTRFFVVCLHRPQLKLESRIPSLVVFRPYLSTLSHLHNFTLESQIHYSSPLSITPIPSSSSPGVHIIPHSSIKAFVNPSAWTLGSHSTLDTASSPTLQFMVFVPKKSRRPLTFELEEKTEGEGRPGGSFLIPQSGSLVLYNANEESLDPEYISLKQLIPLLRTHLDNLQTLLGVPSDRLSDTRLRNTTNPSLGSFQLSNLLKIRTLQNIKSSLGGIEALGRLIKKNVEMKIGPKVQSDYLDALQHLEKVSSCTTRNVGHHSSGISDQRPPSS